MRAQQQTEIVLANHKLVKRIQACRPTYDRQKQLADSRERERWLWNQAVANRPLDASFGVRHPKPPTGTSAGHRPRPQSAQAQLERPRLVGSYAKGDGADRNGGAGVGPAAASRPVRPQTARPAKVERRPSEISRRTAADASVLRVLDLLSAQRTKITSLRELRAQKERLMEPVYTPPPEVRVELLEASDVVINVTTSPACAGSRDELVVLVHGGLFMSGSARASQHLATKLCVELGVPVATPVMRLAPEHPYPAALDDLKAAFAYLTSFGLDSTRASAPPSRIALFAESSGANLAACMIQSRLAAGESLPSCVVLSSPWLDLSCEQGSFMVNEAYDLMMRKDRMVGIAQAYLAGACSPDDPRCSPLMAPPGPAFAFPPTLVHVCQNELLLDDALIFGEHCRSAGCEITVKEYDQALHAWHTYFPLMPVAQQALSEACDFMRAHLLLDETRRVLGPIGEADGEADSDDE